MRLRWRRAYTIAALVMFRMKSLRPSLVALWLAFFGLGMLCGRGWLREPFDVQVGRGKEPTTEGPARSTTTLQATGTAATATLENLALDHAAEAVALLRGLPAGPERDRAARAIGAALAAEDPSLAFTFALALRPGGARAELLRSIATQWGLRDAEAAGAALAGLDDSVGRRTYIEALIATWAERNPRAAAEFTARLGAQEKELARDRLASEWAVRDVGAASAWITGWEAGEARDRLMSTLAAQWIHADPIQAEGWVNSLTESVGRDHAATILSQHLLRESPERALRMAQTIADETLCASTVESLARRWLKRDASAANAWLMTANLPLEVRRRLEGADSR